MIPGGKNTAETLCQSLERGAQSARPLASIIKYGQLSENELALLEKSLSRLGLQAKEIEQVLADTLQKYKVEEDTAKQQIWERKLLDLSLRNNLLNLHFGKNAYLLGCDDIAVLEDRMHSGEEIILQDKALTHLYRTTRNNLEETGANTLFLAIGNLQWTDKHQGKEHKAPVLLMPVEIVRLKGKDNYSIRRRDDETVLNVTLMELLRTEFDITVNGVNPLPTDEHGIDVSLVFHRIASAVSDHPDWKINEEAILGIFSFTKFVMWNDIHNNSKELTANGIVKSLIEGRMVVAQSADLTDIRQEDAFVTPASHMIPLDADSSQITAVIEAEKGHSFILNGPPGTGKSQTITNIIANSLYHGKRVLFVAQKKAALDVVKRRLDKLGLSAYCLELHSNKIDKKVFLQQMQHSIERDCSKEKTEYMRRADELLAERQKILIHVEALHKKHEHGYSLYECIQNALSIDAPEIRLPAEFITEKSTTLLPQLKEKIKALDSGEAILGMAPSEHPLRGLHPKKTAPSPYPFAQKENLEGALSTLPEIIAGIKSQIERNKKIGINNKSDRQYIEGEYKLRKFFQFADIDASLFDNAEELYQTAVRWKDNIGSLALWKEFSEVSASLNEMGLNEIVSLHENGEKSDMLCNAVEKAFYTQLAEKIISTNLAFSDYSTLSFDAILSRYALLHKEFQSLSKDELLYCLSERDKELMLSCSPAMSAEITLLKKRISNKGRGTTIRAMMDQMPGVMGHLCPIMLMSPLSVAQFINAGAEKFDLVIFDEASQMPTCDAVGSIGRSNAAIIVGDSKQMPPTNFFSLAVTDESEADIDDLESILDDCIALSMPAHTLTWHYRSNHEGLIAFSNHHYYNGELITFPSSDNRNAKINLVHVDGFYDMGKTRTNRAEAEAIVKEAVSRLKTEPGRSIGIIAFSLQQSNLIEDLLTDALSMDAEAERLNKESNEPIFIKNLENVQGDERDIILFSIGYGPDKEGKVSMNFGPLNKLGGEKRLNVAITRARYEMKVFSTLLPEQIDERRTQAEGVLGLKEFLRFASGENIYASAVAKNAMTNIMVKDIADWLTLKGYDVDVNVGSSDCKIDIAVTSPTKPEYILGIVMDGDNYYKLKTIRDREIVRPAVFGRLGWKLLRISTIDYFQKPDMVRKRIVDAL